MIWLFSENALANDLNGFFDIASADRLNVSLIAFETRLMFIKHFLGAFKAFFGRRQAVIETFKMRQGFLNGAIVLATDAEVYFFM